MTKDMTLLAELLTKLNHAPDHNLYWGGRADVDVDERGFVNIHLRSAYSHRIEPIMKGLGYKKIREEEDDLGDDDCPKPETFTVWEKLGR